MKIILFDERISSTIKRGKKIGLRRSKNFSKIAENEKYKAKVTSSLTIKRKRTAGRLNGIRAYL
ncbi:MAG: hypothetical protein CH6_1017 [Candidatus Kapaibacterium sp.]|nr:MAG: hypothetical protein CH6_1017 [Candidatus Kapabacteria bacterium]